MVDYDHVGPQPIGHDVIALDEFGGEIGDPEGAARREDGWWRVSILRPRSVTADPDDNADSRDAVRALALVSDFKSRHRRGPVDIVWNPATGKSKRYEEAGEPVDRAI